jgi:hypothetical protein
MAPPIEAVSMPNCRPPRLAARANHSVRRDSAGAAAAGLVRPSHDTSEARRGCKLDIAGFAVNAESVLGPISSCMSPSFESSCTSRVVFQCS